jgi:hypothetical protein
MARSKSGVIRPNSKISDMAPGFERITEPFNHQLYHPHENIY